MNPDGDDFTPQISNAPSANPQPTYQQNVGTQQPLSHPVQTQPLQPQPGPSQPIQPQPIPQQISPINTQPIPVQNQATQQQVPAMASVEQSPELEASTPITGKSRIESAWGSNPEDMGVAIVSGGQSTGEIFKQEYTGWSGTLNPRWMRNWAIYRHHMLGLFKKGHRPWPLLVKIYLFVTLIGCVAPIFPLLLVSLTGEGELAALFTVNRDNLYSHVLAFFPRNILYYPVAASLLVGTIISEDRTHGTSALYFSRPISRLDYTMMKYLSVASILAILCIFTLFAYYTTEIIALGRGWGWIADTLPIFIGTLVAAFLLVITYTSIGLALSSVSKGAFFPGIGLLSIILGTAIIARIVDTMFQRETLFLLSPYDSLANVGQALVGTEPTFDISWTWSLASLVVINALALYILATRVSSMEVTRE